MIFSPAPHSKIMGILNVTPDSFSDGGKYTTLAEALNAVEKMIENGADIIDVGGESSRPGADKISPEEEISRTIPVINAIKKKFSVCVSIDTTKALVAAEAVGAGAEIINDISGGEFEPEIINVAIKSNVEFVVNHTTGTPKEMQGNLIEGKVTNFIRDRLLSLTIKYKSMGLSKIILDPGIGFGKTTVQNYEILSNISEFKREQYPILIGLSRKAFIGKSFDLSIDDRDKISALLEFFSLLNGADIIRTHEVKKVADARKLINLLVENG